MKLSQLPGQEELHEGVMTIISDLVWESMESDAEYRQLDEDYVNAVSEIHKAMGIDAIRPLENAPSGIADVYGAAMFKLGLAIGRDPSLLLTLPKGKNSR